MRNLYAAFLILLSVVGSLHAQTPTWSEDVASVVYNRCASCHHAGSVGPFSLTSYSDAYNERFNVQFAVESGVMPPWHPDTSYQHYAQERYLTTAEIQLISDWVNGGAPEGNPAVAPPPPVFPVGALLPNADLSLEMAPYVSQAFNEDNYVCIALDPGILSQKKVRAFEVIPGDREIVHHVLVYIDESGGYVTDSAYQNCTGPQGGRLLGAYVPGGGPIQFPNVDNLKMGVTLNPGAKIVLAMHYPTGSAGRVDSTSVNLFFHPDGASGVREIFADPLVNDFGFCIDANTVQEVSVTFPPQGGVPGDYSILSVFPHCHLLGKSWEVYGVNFFGGDTVPMIKIPHWDFHWQGFYFFKHIQKLPSFYRIKASCVYDNTANNIHNPNTPPQQVCAGLNTSDEMMIVYFHYLLYQSGDELIDMDSILQIPTSVGPARDPLTAARLTPYPNPANGPMTLDYYLPKSAMVELDVLDVEGRVVRHIWSGRQAAGQYHSRWDGMGDGGRGLGAGVYVVRMRYGDAVVTGRVVKE